MEVGRVTRGAAVSAASFQRTLAACAEADEASADVLARSTLWLAVHPWQHRRLRRRLVRARAELLAARAAWIAEGRPA